MGIKEKLIELVTKISEDAGVKMAIGGGIAVNSYGYRRETADVDAFFHFEDQKKILRALNQHLNNDYVLEELDPSHWTVTPISSPPDERIDLLFAIGDPEKSAIEMAVVRSYHGIKVFVFPIDLLVISKFLAERDDAKDSLDIYTLIRRGAVDVTQVVLRLRQMGLDEDAVRFASFVEYLQQLSSRKRRQ